MRTIKLCFFLLLTVTLTGCSNGEPIMFSELYKGDIEDISRIEIVDGGSGYTRELTSSEVIEQLVSELSQVTFTPLETDAGQLNGLLYGVGFYEKGSETPVFVMSTNIINDKVYEPDKDLGAMFESYYALGDPVN